MLPEKATGTRRMFARPQLSTHRRLIAIITVVNLCLLVFALWRRWWSNLPSLGYLTIGNITACVLVRQQRVVNALFKLATLPGVHAPLGVRWMLGKIYHVGGLHSGCAVAAAGWFLLFTVCATVLRATASPLAPSAALLALTYVVEALLVAIVMLALPRFRMRFHNSFEASHRFLGWTVLALVWAHTVVLIRDYKRVEQALATALFTSVTPYLLVVVTASIISPWVTLRKVRVQITKPSEHAIIVQFRNVRAAFPGSSSSISISPWLEWHSFANIPKAGEEGFRLVISRAGDWTAGVIDKPPEMFWVKGIPTAGVANIETLFTKVLYVCTGSGIGPVMPHLLAQQVVSTLFWSARTPGRTYGCELVREIFEACPDAVVHDTAVLGKPDMVAAAFANVVRSGAEAVIVISNHKLTRKVVYGMESRGIPAFGAIWDS